MLVATKGQEGVEQRVEHAHMCCFHRDHGSHAAPLSKGKQEWVRQRMNIVSRLARVYCHFRIVKDKTTS